MDKNRFASTNWVLEKLGFNKMPLKLALESVVDLVLENEIDLYFEKSTRGTDATVEIEEQYTPDGVFLGPLIGNGYSYWHDDMKLATTLHVYNRHNSSPEFAIQQYRIADKLFYVTDNEGIWNCEKYLNTDEVYFDKNQIESLSKHSAKSIDGITKALALLAREKAESLPKFMTGNKVNASTFKDHLVELAGTYEISASGLKSIDDKINFALKELDINEVKKK